MPKKSGGWRHAIRSHLNSYEFFNFFKRKLNGFDVGLMYELFGREFGDVVKQELAVKEKPHNLAHDLRFSTLSYFVLKSVQAYDIRIK